MNGTFEVHDGCTTFISDAGRQKCASEQSMNRTHAWHTSIVIGSASGLVITFAVLVIKQLLGGV